MTPEALAAHRKELKLSQEEMAKELGMGSRGYQKLESGDSEIRKVHVLAIEAISLKIAVEQKRPMLAMSPTRKQALAFARLINGE